MSVTPDPRPQTLDPLSLPLRPSFAYDSGINPGGLVHKGRLLLWLAAGLLAVAVAAWAQSIVGGTARARDDQVIVVSFQVTDAFKPDMEQAIYSGMPYSFTYRFEIYREIPAWPDLRLYHWAVKRTIRYDTLKKTFTVDLGAGGRPKETQDFAEAKKWMTEFVDHPVAVTTSLDRSYKHYLKVKADLDPVRLPLFLDKIFPFLNAWSFETPWVTIELPTGVADVEP